MSDREYKKSSNPKNGNGKRNYGNKQYGGKNGRRNSYTERKPYSPKPSAVSVSALTENTSEEREDVVFGRNPVFELISSGRGIEKIYLQTGERGGSMGRIVAAAHDRGVITVETDKHRLDELSGGGLHQGVVAIASVKEYCEISDILDYAASKGEKPFIIICENIADPHNLGAIIRTACCAGAHGVIIPKRGGVGVTSTVYKTSAGAAEYVRIAKVNSISNAIGELKEAGVWIYGTDASGESNYTECDMTGSAAVVIGSEGEGMKHQTVKQCDYLVKIPLMGEVNSLNASAAAAVLMYEVVRQRNGR